MTKAVARGVNEYLAEEGVTAEELQEWIENKDHAWNTEWGSTMRYIRALLRIVIKQQEHIIANAWANFN